MGTRQNPFDAPCGGLVAESWPGSAGPSAACARWAVAWICGGLVSVLPVIVGGVSKSPIDDHLDKFDPPQRQALQVTCGVVRAALPGAAETISYGMPTFKVDGVAVLGLDGFTTHNSLFPYSGSVVALIDDRLPGYATGKGTIRFPLDTPFPAALLKRVIKVRIAEINDSYPKKRGEIKVFYDNGYLKTKGKIRGDKMHGAWEWFRRDGSKMRSGSFRDGVKTGDWTTYDRTGAPHKTTRF